MHNINSSKREILKKQDTLNYQVDFENNFQCNIIKKNISMQSIL